jgi:putative transposase
MLKTYRYRLKPTKSQVAVLERQLELCRWVYNDTLAYRKNALENEQRTVKRFETQDRLPQLKLEIPDLKEVYSLVLQNVTLRVELAFKAFFRRVKSGEEPGYPRFKGRGRYDSITYSQSGFDLDSEKLHLSKIGDIKIKLHRPIEGKIKICTVRKMPTGKWFACFSIEMEDVPLPPRKDGPIEIGRAHV